MSTFSYDTEDQLYSTALKQLFTEIYMMKLCLIDLFLSIRNDWSVLIDIDQIMIMMIVTILTIIYQLFLRNIFFSILKYLSVFTKDRENDEEESNWNHFSASALDHLRHLAHICYDWMRSFKKVSRDLQESIDELAWNELNVTDRHEYKHEAADHRSSVIWISKNDLEISEDEIVYVRNCVSDIRISNEFADLDIKKRLKILQNVSNTDIVQ